MKPAGQIRKLFARARNADRRLCDWMRLHHDDLLEELGPKRITWRPIMRVIEQLRLVDELGKTPTLDTARRTWRRVRLEVAAERARRQRPLTLAAPHEIAPGVRMLFGPTEAASERLVSARPRIGLDIRPARAVARESVATDAGGPAALAVQASREVSVASDADAHIRRVFDAIGAARTPMPKIVR